MTAVAGLVAAGLVVSGCGLLSPSPVPLPSQAPTTAPDPSSDPAQTQAEQCAQLMAEVTAIGADLARVGELLGSDWLQAFAVLSDVTNRIRDLETRVTDPALLERIGEIQAGWDAMVADATEAAQAGDAAGIERATAALTALGEQVASLQEFCAGTA